MFQCFNILLKSHHPCGLDSGDKIGWNYQHDESNQQSGDIQEHDERP